MTLLCKSLTRRKFLKNALYGSMAAAGVYTALVEHQIVRTNYYRIPVPHLPEPFEGLRIVHLTDIHYGKWVSEGFIRRIVRRRLHRNFSPRS